MLIGDQSELGTWKVSGGDPLVNKFQIGNQSTIKYSIEDQVPDIRVQSTMQQSLGRRPIRQQNSEINLSTRSWSICDLKRVSDLRCAGCK